MFHKEMWMQDLLDIKLAAAAGNYENPFHREYFAILMIFLKKTRR